MPLEAGARRSFRIKRRLYSVSVKIADVPASDIGSREEKKKMENSEKRTTVRIQTHNVPIYRTTDCPKIRRYGVIAPSSRLICDFFVDD